MRGYKDIEVEIEKLLIEELPKLQIDVVQLQTIGKIYTFVRYILRTVFRLYNKLIYHEPGNIVDMFFNYRKKITLSNYLSNCTLALSNPHIGVRYQVA